jgi:hypothetical protein
MYRENIRLVLGLLVLGVVACSDEDVQDAEVQQDAALMDAQRASDGGGSGDVASPMSLVDAAIDSAVETGVDAAIPIVDASVMADAAADAMVDTAPDTATISCGVCSAPAHGTAMCSGNACVSSCNAGYKLCGLSCIAEEACCANSDCTAVAGGVCNTGKCSYTTRIYADKDMSGFVSTTGLVGLNNMTIGEANDNLGYKAFLSFSRAGLPGTLVVDIATLAGYQSSCSNDPYANGHGKLLLKHVSYGALNSAVMNATIPGTDNSEFVFATDASVGARSVDVKEWVAFDAANNVGNGLRWQFRLEFTTMFVADSVGRRCVISNTLAANPPYMDVQYHVP